jgi:1-deoxy-D-xylulose-5-phosphate reductoisomerase
MRGRRGVAILGSTGSIGRSTLEVLRRHPDEFRLVALTGGGNAELLGAQVDEWKPSYAGLVNGNGHAPRFPSGPDVLVDAATQAGADIVVNAVVGAAGLAATIAALKAGKRVALANKESLVMAGPLVLAAAREGGGELVPVDSEHSAVLQCLAGQRSAACRLTLTASGGPFREWDAAAVAAATVEQALAHPTWNMGRKITVDSATLANKALEIIEAHFLFGLTYDALDAVVHPQSIVHALVEFCDGSVMAQIGFPTMELPILYALTWPDRVPDMGVPRFDPLRASPLTFEPVRHDVFGAFHAGVEAGRAGGTAPAVFNAANEVAVAAFLDGQIRFGDIAHVICGTLDAAGHAPMTSLDDVLTADRSARQLARDLIQRMSA